MLEDTELARRAQVRVGSTLRGKYRIDAVLGVGGMAAVYRATHRNQAEFAIKVLHPELSLSEDLRSRFLREGYAANSVKHPGVVRIVDDDVGEDGAAFLVMELLHGKGVDALWEHHGQRLPARLAVSIGEQVLEVLAAAHDKGIVHRDIKPQNLFVIADGSVKVLDFGIARARDAAAFGSGGQGTGTGILLGTPAFMAPEQALAKSRDIDARTDLWALSATLFTLLSGELVHAGENPAQLLVMAATEHVRPLASLAPDVPAPIADVIDRGLAFDKIDRWPDAAAMREALCEAHRAVFGAGPSRIALDEMTSQRTPTITGTPALAGSVHPSAAVKTPAAAVFGASTTASGMVSASAQLAAAAKAKSKPGRARLVIAAAALAAAAVGVGLRVTTGHTGTPVTVLAPTTTAAVLASTPPGAAAPSMAATGEGASAPLPGSVVPSSAAPPVAAPPLVSPPVPAPSAAQGLGRPGPHHPVPHAAPAPAASSPGQCEPPYYYDAQGNRVFKKECL
jgi:hypothetical protein